MNLFDPGSPRAGRQAGDRAHGAAHMRLVGETQLIGQVGKRLACVYNSPPGQPAAHLRPEGRGRDAIDLLEAARHRGVGEPMVARPVADAQRRVGGERIGQQIGPVPGMGLRRRGGRDQQIGRGAWIALWLGGSPTSGSRRPGEAGRRARCHPAMSGWRPARRRRGNGFRRLSKASWISMSPGPHPDTAAIARLLVGAAQHQRQIGAAMPMARDHLPGRPLLEPQRARDANLIHGAELGQSGLSPSLNRGWRLSGAAGLGPILIHGTSR